MDNPAFNIKEVLEKFVQEMEEISQVQSRVNDRVMKNLGELDRRLADLEIAVGITGMDSTELQHSSNPVEFEQKMSINQVAAKLAVEIAKDVDADIMKDIE